MTYPLVRDARSTVRQFFLRGEYLVPEARFRRLPRSTMAETSRPPRSVIQEDCIPFDVTRLSLPWNILPSGVVQVFYSNVSLHGNTEFASNDANYVGGKPMTCADHSAMPL